MKKINKRREEGEQTKKNNIKNIIIHNGEIDNLNFLSDRINKFHSEIIERKLNETNLSPKQKILVVEKIIKYLKSRENNGIIK